MDSPYTFLHNLAAEVEPPRDGTLSRTLLNNDQVKVVLFGFAAGQELSEHTASMPAILQFMTGEASLKLGNDRQEAGPGTFVYMPPGLPHAVAAKTPVVMLLLLLKSAHASMLHSQ